VRLDTRSSSDGAILTAGKARHHFPAYIEATDQRLSSAKDLRFPSLQRQGVIQDVGIDDGSHAKRGIAINGFYHPISAFECSHRLFCLSLPFLFAMRSRLPDHEFNDGRGRTGGECHG
jgi:hypothetical protein